MPFYTNSEKTMGDDGRRAMGSMMHCVMGYGRDGLWARWAMGEMGEMGEMGAGRSTYPLPKPKLFIHTK